MTAERPEAAQPAGQHDDLLVLAGRNEAFSQLGLPHRTSLQLAHSCRASRRRPYEPQLNYSTQRSMDQSGAGLVTNVWLLAL